MTENPNLANAVPTTDVAIPAAHEKTLTEVQRGLAMQALLDGGEHLSPEVRRQLLRDAGFDAQGR